MERRFVCPNCKCVVQPPVAEFSGWVARRGGMNSKHVFEVYPDPSGQFFSICWDYGEDRRGWGDTPEAAAMSLKLGLEEGRF